jgi:hypothetical protein
MFAAIVFGGLILSVLMPAPKKPKNSSHELGDAIAKFMKDNSGDKDKKKD